jgi:NAD dependent epimerase/dehydratase family enzyme
VNAVAPEPVRNAEFTRALARAVSRPALLPVPSFAVRAALGEVAGELLASRLVVPARAAAAGYEFRHPALASALAAEL